MLKRAYELVYNIVRYYLDFHISRASAALSYFLMLTIFPLLICLYAVLGSLFPSAEELSELLGAFLPSGTMETLTEFLEYVSLNSSGRMLSLAVAAMATSSAAGYRIIDKLMFELRGIRRRERFWAFVFSFLFSLVFLAALYISALLMATGGWFIRFADEYFNFINISHNWEWLRFFLLFHSQLFLLQALLQFFEELQVYLRLSYLCLCLCV